jgi:hypothetical protein
MNRRRAVYTAFALVLGALGCNAILGVEAAGEYVPSSTDFPNPYPESQVDATVDGPALQCANDLATDAHNCGRCGRECGPNLQCTDGRCAAVKLAADLAAAPARLVVAGGRGFYSTAPTFTVLRPAPLFRCYQSKVFSFPVRDPGPVVHVASPCAYQGTEWGTDGTHVFGWAVNQALGASTGTLSRFGPEELPDGGENDAGTPVLQEAGIRDFVVPDPARPGQVLLGPKSASAPPPYSVEALYEDGGLVNVLSIAPPPGVFGIETLRNLDTTPSSFVAVSINGGGEPRIWTAPRGCDASACETTIAATYATICGVRRFGNVVRWCGIQIDPSGQSFLLVLLEADPDKGSLRVVNSAPVITRGSNGTAVLPILRLEDTGIYYARGVRIDLLPLVGPPVPVALTSTKPLLLAADDVHLYWAEVDAIYRVVR